MSSLTTAPPSLTPDAIDDLIYACRTDDLDSLKEQISHWSTQLNTTEAAIIKSAIDIDEDGLGSRACLLHYPAGNGKLQMIQYLLDRLGEPQTQTQTQTQINGTSTEGKIFVNHQNVSGNTPLHWAALNGHIEIVRALVKAGADPTVVNGAGRDAVVEAEYSSQEGAGECAVWLLRECEVLERGAGGGEGEGSAEVEDMAEEGKDGEKENGEEHEKETATVSGGSAT
ncbi:ankyrin repeat-containing protein [Knufia obscura]|uniref:Ankyrin repeat-containing protein n=2 Tax=Knufia TaxID=430999 RepID=A0AAN8EAH6_9EURO|nr:ankyrin repeat-containing protein [Knufia obscura]KAK5950088.1 ankyrin repeat-containing protein [Knufia fluminis]